MMALRRTPLLPPGWGRGRPRHSSIGASSAAGAARGGAGLLLAVGGECVALQIGFRHLTHFLLISTGVVATLVEADWWLSPLPIVGSLPSLQFVMDRDRLDRRRGGGLGES